jgi:uncharacterized membrane protein YphA (DoxX/SURF4 family)
LPTLSAPGFPDAGEEIEFPLLALGIALALVLGGAGLWSVDARPAP